MGEISRRTYYGECCKIHEKFGNKADGCQAFEESGSSAICSACQCHRNFHKYVTAECHKIHPFDGAIPVDGCKEFKWPSDSSLACAACGCHLSFHRQGVVKKYSHACINSS